MRTNIEIDDALMAAAMKAGGFKTKKETVEAALQAFARRSQAYAQLRALRGKVDWDSAYDYKTLRESGGKRLR